MSKLEKKNIVILPHLNLLDNFKKLENLESKSKLSIHLPNYIFQTSMINVKETVFTKKFTLKKNSYLSDLEAESIHIIRGVVSETKNPVMLYSVGKDSSVMLHLAKKAFYPSPPPFPLMHVDTRWKFREMYLFRNWMAKQSNMKLITHINPDGIKDNINPFDHGSSVHTDIMKTQGLKQALDQYEFDAANAIEFGLHNSERTEIILRILLYQGIVIRDPQVVQVAAQKVQQEEVNEKS